MTAVERANERTDLAEDDPTDDEPAEGLIGRTVGRGQGVLARVDHWQQHHRPVAIAFAVVKKFGDDRAGNLAALVSYFLFFSLFPLMLAFTTIVGFVLSSRPDLQQQVVDSALANFPIVGDQIRSSVGVLSGNVPALVIGLVGALWGGMGAVGAMQSAMNTIWGVPLRDRPNLLQERLRSLIMLVVLGASVVLTTALGSAGGAVDGWGWAGRALVIAVSAGLNVGLYWLSFKVLTRRPLAWGSLLPGAVVAGFAFTALQAFGGLYVTHVVSGAGAMYGTFAIVLGLLSWLFLIAQVSVYAAEINVVRSLGMYPRSLVGDTLTGADKLALRHYAKAEERHPDETIDIWIDTTPSRPSERGDDTTPAADDPTRMTTSATDGEAHPHPPTD